MKSLQDRIIELFKKKGTWRLTELVQELQTSNYKEILQILNILRMTGQITKTGRIDWTAVSIPGRIQEENPLVPKNVIYSDWQEIVSKLLACNKLGLNVLLIGPAGCGKTEAIRKAAEIINKPLHIIPMSLRTREHHIIGRLDTDELGNIYFKEGPLIQSMKLGGITYFDELNTAEQDSLIRVDEALDHRKEINVEGMTYKASEGWWCTASINPMDRYHIGTKTLPAQILSRFQIKLELKYPIPQVEYEIVKMHVPKITERYQEMLSTLDLIAFLRTTDLPYIPSVRESIAIAKLLSGIPGLKLETAIKMTLLEVYSQWSPVVIQQARELIESKIGGLD